MSTPVRVARMPSSPRPPERSRGRTRWLVLAALAVVGLGAGIAIGAWRWHAQAPPANLQRVTSRADLAQVLAQHHGRALLEVGATWCPPCQELAPRLAELARADPTLLVLTVDATTASEVATAYAAETLPLLVLIEDGHERRRQVGAPALPALTTWVEGR